MFRFLTVFLIFWSLGAQADQKPTYLNSLFQCEDNIRKFYDPLAEETDLLAFPGDKDGKVGMHIFTRNNQYFCSFPSDNKSLGKKGQVFQPSPAAMAAACHLTNGDLPKIEGCDVLSPMESRNICRGKYSIFCSKCRDELIPLILHTKGGDVMADCIPPQPQFYGATIDIQGYKKFPMGFKYVKGQPGDSTSGEILSLDLSNQRFTNADCKKAEGSNESSAEIYKQLNKRMASIAVYVSRATYFPYWNKIMSYPSVKRNASTHSRSDQSLIEANRAKLINTCMNVPGVSEEIVHLTKLENARKAAPVDTSKKNVAQ